MNALIATKIMKFTAIEPSLSRSLKFPTISTPNKKPYNPNIAPDAPALGTKALKIKLAMLAPTPHKK